MRRLVVGKVLSAVGIAAGALAVAGALIAATGGAPLECLVSMWQGAAGTPEAGLRTLAKATPLLLSGLAVAIGLRAGLFNIGAEGQLMVGAIAAAWCGAWIKGAPMWVHLPLCLLVGGLAGAAWAFVPGALKAWRGTHEVIVTIMMNYLAAEGTHYLVNGPLRDRSGQLPATPIIEASARLWGVRGGANFNAGFFLAVAAAALVWFLVARTALGFEIRAVGVNPGAARAGGISVGRVTVISMLLSGLLAGLAGSVEVLGVHHRFYDAFSPGYGFDSIAIALLGGLHPAGITLSAILFGGLASASTHLEAWNQVPRQVAGVIEAVAIIGAAIYAVSARRRRP